MKAFRLWLCVVFDLAYIHPAAYIESPEVIRDFWNTLAQKSFRKYRIKVGWPPVEKIPDPWEDIPF